MNIDEFRVGQSDTSQLSLTGIAPGLNFVCGPPEARRTAHRFLTRILAGGPGPIDGYEGSVLVNGSDGWHWLRSGDQSRSFPASPQSAFSLDFADTRPISSRKTTSVATDHSLAFDQLLARRDQLADEVEKRIGDNRRRDYELHEELQRLDLEARRLSEEYSANRNQLHGINQQLAASVILDKKQTLRGLSIPANEGDRHAEIDRCRQILREFEARQQAIDQDLNSNVSLGSARRDLNSQRACLNATERLLSDLKAEVSRLADTGQRETCACVDVIPRLMPLVGLLDEQVYSLCSLLGKEQRRARRKILTREREQLARCQAEIREQIQLLQRDETGRDYAVEHDAWAHRDADYCGCESHEQFRGCTNANGDRATLVHEQERLKVRLREIKRSLAQIKHNRRHLEQQRAEIGIDSTLSRMLRELFSLQEQLEPLEQERQERTWSLQDDHCYSMAACSLHGGDWDFSHWDFNDKMSALRTFANSGSRLPLLLNNPLDQNDETETAALLRELQAISQGGRQVLIFTDEASIQNQHVTGNPVHRLNLSISQAAHTAPATRMRPAESGVAVTQRRRSGRNGSSTETTSRPSTARAFAVLADMTAEDEAILAACGISDLDQLAGADADQLYANLRRFLASDAGRRYRRSGRRYDRSRMRSWISGARQNRASGRRRSSSQAQRAGQTQRASQTQRSGQSQRSRQSQRGKSSRQGKRTRTSAERRSSRPNDRRRDRESNGERRSTVTSSRTQRTRAERKQQSSSADGNQELRHYLNTSDPVVDAPTIGPKMAERLQPIGIHTVDDLLRADADQVAEQLQHRSTSAETVRQWQKQARLVCCIPQIRGHDAQILVACDITDPQQLVRMEPPQLLSIVDPFASSKEGKRIIRGGQKPDLEEVTDWINWAKQSRDVKAA